MVKRLSYNEVKDFFKNNGYTLLNTEYKNNKTDLDVICPHGHHWTVRFSNFKNGIRCSSCQTYGRKTIEDFKEEVQSRVGDEYIVLSNIYINTDTKIDMKHNTVECGYEYKVRPNSFLRGQRCPQCFGVKKRTVEKFKSEVYELEGDDYIVLSEKLVNSNQKIRLKHNIEECGHEFLMRPQSFVSSRNRCPQCFGKNKKTTTQYKEEVYDLVGDDYKILGKYETSKTLIETKHDIEECGYIWGVSPNNFLRRSRCPKCSSSLGEKIIADFLSLNSVNYIHDKTYSPECKDKKALRFDFQIFENNTLLCMVEYDGRQHFAGWDGKEGSLKDIQRRDQIKNQYCKDNNIPLIRISYKQFDSIETILEKELTALGIISEESIESILV